MLYPDINSQKKTQQTRYRTALYLRLSREDGDKTESDSVANQRTLLEAYAADHPELCIVDEFVDDGYPARTLNGLRSKTCSGNWSRGPSTVFW